MSNIYDFGSQLSAIGDTIAQNREANRQREILNTIGGMKDAAGNIDYGRAAETALRLGDIKTATALATINNANLQRAAEARKEALSPWMPDPNRPGGLVYRPGGPEDPNVKADAHAATRDPPRLSVTDITNLDKQAEKFHNLTGFVKDFRPEFAGYTVPGSGAAATWAGRNLPDWALEATGQQGTREAATFWQGYDRFKNVVRNELFGSALTPGESKAFAAADIDPSMNPQQIKINLARQHELAQLGMQRKAATLIQSGYSPDVVARALGVPLQSLGITPGPQRQFGTQPQPQATVTPPPRPETPPPPPGTPPPAPGTFADRYAGTTAPRPPPPDPKTLPPPLSGNAPPAAPQTPAATPQTPPQAARVPNSAQVQLLGANRNNPQAIAQFEAKFGPGSAQRALGQQ